MIKIRGIIFGFRSCSKLSTVQNQWLSFSSILEKEAGRHKKCSGFSAVFTVCIHTHVCMCIHAHTQPQTSTVFKLNTECFQGRSRPYPWAILAWMLSGQKLSLHASRKESCSFLILHILTWCPSGAAVLQQPNHHCLAMDTWASYFYSKFKFTHHI